MRPELTGPGANPQSTASWACTSGSKMWLSTSAAASLLSLRGVDRPAGARADAVQLTSVGGGEGDPVPLVAGRGEEGVDVLEAPASLDVHGGLAGSEAGQVLVEGVGVVAVQPAREVALLLPVVDQIRRLDESFVREGCVAGQCVVYLVGAGVAVEESTHRPLVHALPLGVAGRERHDAGSVQGIGDLSEFFGGGRRGQAELVEDGLVVPEQHRLQLALQAEQLVLVHAGIHRPRRDRLIPPVLVRRSHPAGRERRPLRTPSCS